MPTAAIKLTLLSPSTGGVQTFTKTYTADMDIKGTLLKIYTTDLIVDHLVFFPRKKQFGWVETGNWVEV